jgi:hypothetical protein
MISQRAPTVVPVATNLFIEVTHEVIPQNDACLESLAEEYVRTGLYA